MSSKRKYEEVETRGVSSNGRAYEGSEEVRRPENVVSELPDLSVETLQGVYNALCATTLVQQPLLEAIRLLDRYVTSIEWTSPNTSRDIIIDYFTANEEFLPTIVNLWSFSWEQNFQHLAIQIPNTLRRLLASLCTAPQLYRIASSIVQMTLDNQLRHIYRILSSNKFGPAMSAIDFLTQMASIPKSPAPDMLYRLVISGFSAWPQLLSQKGSMREKEIQRAAKARKVDGGPTLRTMAVKFMLAILQYGSTTTKENLLGNRLLMSPFIKFLPLDTNETVLAVLDCLRTRVLSDKRISRPVKTSFFSNEQTLLRISSLLSRDYEDGSKVREAVNRFLLEACTRVDNGVCFEDRGWYPRLETHSHETDWQLYNNILFRLITQLRPLENQYVLHLVLRILEKCPELRHPYFSRIQNPVEPELSLSFINTISFWLEILRLPLPQNMSEGSSLPEKPPPLGVVLGNIRPGIFTKQYLIKGLTNPSPIVRYTTCQLILAILQKLSELTQLYRSAGASWRAEVAMMIVSIAKHLPDSSSILTLHSTNTSHRLITLCSIKVLSLYSELLSGYSDKQRFDPKPLTIASEKAWDLESPIDFIDGINLLRIVNKQSGLNWWARQGSKLSLFALLLKRRAMTTQAFSKRQLDEALERLPQRTGTFQSTTIIRPLSQIAEALENLVRTSDYTGALDVVLDFIDESFSRFLQKPYTFFDETASVIKQDRRRRPFSCVLCSFARQWQYTVNNETDEAKTTIITEYFYDLLFRSAIIGESPDALVALLRTMKVDTNWDGKIAQLRQRILGFTSPDTIGDSLNSRAIPGTEKWSKISNKSLSYILTHLRSQDFTVRSKEIISEARDNVEQLTPWLLVLVLRRCIALHLFDESSNCATCLSTLLELLELLKDYDHQRFQDTKLALGQLFLSYISPDSSYPNCLEEFSILLKRFYDEKEAKHLVADLEHVDLLQNRLAEMSLLTLTSTLERLVPYCSEEGKRIILTILLNQFSEQLMIGPNASFMVSCIGFVFDSSRDVLSRPFSCSEMYVLFRLGTEIETPFLDEIFHVWLTQWKDANTAFIDTLLGFESLWKSTSFTTFEAKILCRLSLHSEKLTKKFVKKISASTAETRTVKAVLSIRKELTGQAESQTNILKALNTFLTRSKPVMEKLLTNEDRTEMDWDILADYVSQSEDIDLEGWLGLVCKQDQDLVPQASLAIMVILKRDETVFHRALPGWIARTFSRLTRRFAEDNELSKSVLTAVERLANLIASMLSNADRITMVYAKASHIETMMSAAISNYLYSEEVLRLFVVLLSSPKLSSYNFYATHLLQSILGHNHQSDSKMNTMSNTVRHFIAEVITKLYFINPIKNRSESIIIGILNLYTGSRSSADRLLLSVLQHADKESSLSLISSSETWNAFKTSWSRFHHDAISSTLQSPIVIIDSQITRTNIYRFATGELARPEELKDTSLIASDLYDPNFWLPVIGYCLEKVAHQSELLLLVEIYAIGYALVCLSSEMEATRKMAQSVLVTFESRCQEYDIKEKFQVKTLMDVTRNSGNPQTRLPKFITVFLSESLQVMMNPSHILYEKVNTFFLQRPAVDLNDIPMFYTLANSGQHFEQEVIWLLDIVKAGLDDVSCATALKRRHLVEFCLGLYHSRTGRQKSGRSQLPRKIQELFTSMFSAGHLTSALISKYGLGAFLRGESAFGEMLSGDFQGSMVSVLLEQS